MLLNNYHNNFELHVTERFVKGLYEGVGGFMHREQPMHTANVKTPIHYLAISAQLFWLCCVWRILIAKHMIICVDLDTSWVIISVSRLIWKISCGWCFSSYDCPCNNVLMLLSSMSQHDSCIHKGLGMQSHLYSGTSIIQTPLATCVWIRVWISIVLHPDNWVSR